MSQKPFNPAAFPRAVTEEGGGQEGMSLRQHYAGQALAGLLASMPADKWMETINNERGQVTVIAAALRYADDLMAAEQGIES